MGRSPFWSVKSQVFSKQASWPPNARLVALAIADRMHYEGDIGVSWCSIRDISGRTGLGRRAVMNALKALSGAIADKPALFTRHRRKQASTGFLGCYVFKLIVSPRAFAEARAAADRERCSDSTAKPEGTAPSAVTAPLNLSPPGDSNSRGALAAPAPVLQQHRRISYFEPKRNSFEEERLIESEEKSATHERVLETLADDLAFSRRQAAAFEYVKQHEGEDESAFLAARGITLNDRQYVS